MTIILGVDPGLEKTGLGLIKIENNQAKYLTHHLVLTKKTHSLEKRLVSLFEQAQTFLKDYQISTFIIEEIFVGINRNTIIKLSMARSVLILLGGMMKADIIHIPTRVVKQKITGAGNAKKEEVQTSIQQILNIKIDQIDCSDALACALMFDKL